MRVVAKDGPRARTAAFTKVRRDCRRGRAGGIRSRRTAILNGVGRIRNRQDPDTARVHCFSTVHAAGQVNRNEGNPMAELPKAAQGTFDELLAGVEPDLAAIARRLRAIIRAVDVNTVETVRLGDNAATYGVGPKKMTDGYAYIMPMRGYINLGFYQGAVLADPERLLEGTGKGLRHVKIRSLAEANRPPVRALVAAALARRRSGATGPARASTPRRSR